ncbi:piggyBac transposable element-derived protein 4-like [Diprion similis]|uniref:piggyBac transposable element-derived protein 4-like n=1 Tax=Diprion similis TaxID=362088 RepID=UPI001EF820B7|nr:piggyBac transposable element-derived protein 4-like [Diprion similis]
MDNNNYCDGNVELSDSEDAFDFSLSEDIVEDYVDDNSDSSSCGSEIIQPKRRRMVVIESDSEESSEDLDEWRDVTEELDIPDRIHLSVSPKNKEISSHSIWKTWRAVEEGEFWAFIGVIINMGMIPLANMQDYWSIKENSHIPYFCKIFTRKRFMQIFWMLHLKTPDPAKNDIRTRIQQASNVLEYMNSRFSDYFIPGENICVDESVVKFKGKISFITYHPNKPIKWGIRIYVLADSETGYVYSILPYYGSITSENLSRPDSLASTRITLHLYYTSIPLSQELRKMKCHLTGTIQINREGVPTSLNKPKLKEKKTVAYKQGNTMLLAWRDKRIVTLLSNWHNAGMITTNIFIRGGTNEVIEKPSVVVGYTKSMGGVDRADQYASSYCFLRISLKWWRKLFF